MRSSWSQGKIFTNKSMIKTNLQSINLVLSKIVFWHICSSLQIFLLIISAIFGWIAPNTSHLNYERIFPHKATSYAYLMARVMESYFLKEAFLWLLISFSCKISRTEKTTKVCGFFQEFWQLPIFSPNRNGGLSFVCNTRFCFMKIDDDGAVHVILRLSLWKRRCTQKKIANFFYYENKNVWRRKASFLINGGFIKQRTARGIFKTLCMIKVQSLFAHSNKNVWFTTIYFLQAIHYLIFLR